MLEKNATLLCPLSVCWGEKAMEHRAPASSTFCLLILSSVSCGESPCTALISCVYVHSFFEGPVKPVLHPLCESLFASCTHSGAQPPKAWGSFCLDIPQAVMTFIDKFVTRIAGLLLYFALNLERKFFTEF